MSEAGAYATYQAAVHRARARYNDDLRDAHDVYRAAILVTPDLSAPGDTAARRAYDASAEAAAARYRASRNAAYAAYRAAVD